MAAITIFSDFGAPQNKVSHCFHSLPIYLPWSDGTRCHDLCFKPTFSLSTFTFIELVMPSNHLILYFPLFLTSIFPSIRVFSIESVLHIRWPNYRSFSFSISLSNEYSGLISFRMDWLDLLVVQGYHKSLLQHHSPNHQFFSAQLSLWSNSHIHT